jgi:hypothetical protein
MKKFFNLTTIIVTAVLVAGAVFFLWTGSYATAVMTLVALYWAYMARRSELVAADNFEIIGDLVSHRDSLQAERDKLLAENKALGAKVTQLLEESAKVPGNAGEKEPVQTAKPLARKRSRSKRPIQDIKESLKEISPKKEAE